MEAGDLISGRYRIIGLAGVGGMGRVYRAYDEKTGVDVALKLLTLDARRYARRFAREADVMAELLHPKIVAYVGYGETDAGAPFIVMEWVEGEDLRQRMNRKAITLSEAQAILVEVGSTLAFAHDRGVIHRDLKPSNLMLVDRSIHNIKLLDFGIARWRGPDVEKMTRTGISIGTPGYMAPEQGRGEAQIDGRADLYALGSVVFECLTGQRPFQGEDAVAVLKRTASDYVPRVSDTRKDISPELDDLLASLLALSPEDRPITGYALTQMAKGIRSAAIPSPQKKVETGLSQEERQLFTNVEMQCDASSVTVASESQFLDSVQRLGGLAFVGAAGTWQAVFALGSAPTAAVAKAARCALTLKALYPTARIGMTTGYREGSTPRERTLDSSKVFIGAYTDNAPVFVDRTTQSLLDPTFVTGPWEFDGQPGELAGASLLGEEAMHATCLEPYFGRHPERQELLSCLSRVVATQTGSGVVLMAASGLGKTSLALNFTAQAQLAYPDLQVWHARGDAMHQGTAFHMFRQLLSEATKANPADDLDTRQKKLEATVAQVVAEEDTSRVTEFLGELAGLPFPITSDESILPAARENVALMGEQMRRAWEDFLSACTAQGPLVLVLDDLQVGDLPTLRLLDSALRNASGPWMVLACAQPNLDSVYPTLWREHDLPRIYLHGLEEEACTAWIDSSLGDLSSSVRGRLVELSRHVPSHLAELIGAVRRNESEHLPVSLLALAQTAYCELPSRLRRILRAASVFTNEFSIPALRALLPDIALDKMLPAIRDLVQQELLLSNSQGSLAYSAQYRFADQVVREHAYSTLTQHDHRRGHFLAGSWLESQANRNAFALATHFEHAQRGEKAAHWYDVAAREALVLHSVSQARRCAEAGLTHASEPRTLGRLHATMVRVHLSAGDMRDALEHSVEARSRLVAGSRAWTSVARDTVVASCRTGALGIATQMARELARWPVVGPICATLAMTASELFFLGRRESASGIMELLSDAFANLDCLTKEIVGWLLVALASRCWAQGNLGEYLTFCERAYEALCETAEYRGTLMAGLHLGRAYTATGNVRRAEDVLRDTLRDAVEAEEDVIAARAHHLLGEVMCEEGMLDAAWELQKTALVAATQHGDLGLQCAVHLRLSKLSLARGDLQRAKEDVRSALNEGHAFAPVTIEAHVHRASILLVDGNPEAGLKECYTAANRLKGVAPLGTSELHQKLVTFEVLRAMNSGDANGVLQACIRDFEKGLQSLPDSVRTEDFLERVSLHRRICQVARDEGLRVAGKEA